MLLSNCTLNTRKPQYFTQALLVMLVKFRKSAYDKHSVMIEKKIF